MYRATGNPPSCIHGVATGLMYRATGTPPHVFMEWPQGLCIEPLGPPLMYSWNGQGLCIEPLGPPTWNGHKAYVWSHYRTPLMYSWNGHKAYVWSHLDPPYVFMEWPQGLCMEPLGPPSCIHGMATRLMYGATRIPPHVFMEWPQDPLMY